MWNFLLAFTLLALSAQTAKAAAKLWRKPVYLMVKSRFSSTALSIEKTYKLVVLIGFTAVFLVSGISIFVGQFVQL